MTAGTRIDWRGVAAGLLALALWAPTAATASDEADPVAELQPPAASAPQIERFEFWSARAATERARLDEARTRLDAANAAVSRMQSRNQPRGEARREIRDEQAAAQAAYDAARHVVEVELPAEARAAGAPERWLRGQQ